MQIVLKRGSIDKPLTFNNGLYIYYNSFFILVCSFNTYIYMQGVFNPNILIYHPPNSAEGLLFLELWGDWMGWWEGLREGRKEGEGVREGRKVGEKERE